MIWFIIEHWLIISVVTGYLEAVAFAYARFGKHAAFAVAALDFTMIVYRKGQTDAQRRYEQRQEQARREREDVERNVGAMSSEDIHRELSTWRKD